MTRDDMMYFTRRITQGNKSDIIVCVYDIYFTYEEDARRAYKREDRDMLTTAVRHMTDCVSHLMEALDFTYELSEQLYPLYDFVQRCLSKVFYKRDIEPIDQAASVMKELREAFIEVAKADESGRQMQNAETITAGYTYGRDSLNEIAEGGLNRGFFA